MQRLVDNLYNQLVELAPKLLAAIVIVAGAWVLGRIARAAAYRLAGHFDLARRQILHLAGGVGYAVILIIGCVTALGTVGVNVTALVAGLGLTGFALGFAMRDALSNVVAGLMILIYRPFLLGSTVTVAGCEGKVTQINLRFTVLHGPNKTFLVPNSTLLTNVIIVAAPLPEEPKT